RAAPYPPFASERRLILSKNRALARPGRPPPFRSERNAVSRTPPAANAISVTEPPFIPIGRLPGMAGTTFASSPLVAREANPRRLHVIDRTSARANVLVVDDERGPRESLRMILSPAYRVLTVANGSDALEVLRTTPIDVVTLD